MNRRRFLTAKEVQAMMQAARQGPTGERDYCLILLAFRHGMRISELLDLHYRDLDLNEGRINVRRLRRIFDHHPLRFDEAGSYCALDPGFAPAGKRHKNQCDFYFPPRHSAFPPAGLSDYS